ncbi:MAG TPA: adenosylmethionine--8-amino-7-oxononanoate aminotransferase BioA, partial [Thermoanaerobaculia bacterium]|nr:adenosylmethionine--8-amino-7-oxononanoate aminotransferase BioA [Thermoanaerobaculia bacterium]
MSRSGPLPPSPPALGAPPLSPLADGVEADRRHVWHPYPQMQTAPPPLPVGRAEGVYLYTADGRRLLDGISSWWVNI